MKRLQLFGFLLLCEYGIPSTSFVSMDALIEQCTSEKHTQDQWDLILRVCEEYASKEPKACLKAIGKRIFHKNPNVSLRAITLLDACSKNCGKPFNRECASRDFTQLVKSKFSHLQRIPSVKLVEVFEKWSEEFKLDSELALAASLYAWVKSDHYDVIRNLLEDRKAIKAGVVRRSAAQLKAKEDEELAKAIALSLKESDGKRPTDSSTPFAVTSQPSNNATNVLPDTSKATTLYPNFFDSIANPARPLAKGRVRALYDFEAAEDNELTFKAGELIVLQDDSDENWWRGSNHRGEGLFPAQFVTREEDEPGSSKVPLATTSAKTAVAAPITQPQAPVRLDSNKLDECLRLINSVDVTGELQPDPPELPQLEAECYAMAPLIDPELEKVDRRIMMLSDLHQRLLKAFEMYHDLMSKSQTAYHLNAVDGLGTTTYVPLPNMIPYGHQQPSIPGSVSLGYESGSGVVSTQPQPGPSAYAPPESVYPNQMHFPSSATQSVSGHIAAPSTAYYHLSNQPPQFGPPLAVGTQPSHLTHQQYYPLGSAHQFITNGHDVMPSYEPTSLDFRRQGTQAHIPESRSFNDATNGVEGLPANVPFSVPAGK